MQPTPFLHALPNLAAIIDDQRPLISAALLDVFVTAIHEFAISVDVSTQHSYDILSSPAQHEYLNKALSQHWQKEAEFRIYLNIPPAQAPSPTPAAPKRTANTLTFTERANLQHWMGVSENTDYVANESDALAAGKATGDLKMDITAGNIASMRKILGIEKTKPVKPAPLPVHDIDLVALHAQVQQHHLQLDPIAGVNIAEVLSNLRNSLHEIKDRLDALESANN